MIKPVSFRHAANGIFITVTKHPNIQFHLLAGVITLTASWIFHLTRLEFLIILFTIGLVITSEMINTAIESMVDLITLEYRQEAKIAKDVAAGMVLINSILALIVGLTVFIPHILVLLS